MHASASAFGQPARRVNVLGSMESIRMLKAVLCASLLASISCGVLAGELNPPAGAVAPTMKNLQQVEPRTAINAANTPGDGFSQFVISQPGSYYLTNNIAGVAGLNGIRIASVNVTLDLNGFSLIGIPSSGDGIFMSNFFDNVVIRNGTIRGWGGSGINASVDSGRIEGITSSFNLGWGISNTGAGTFTTHIVGCEALSNTQGGIRGGQVSRIEGCISSLNQGPGISVLSRSMVRDCLVSQNADGIVATGSCHVVGCNSASNASSTIESAGIRVQSGGAVVEGNTVSGNEVGIFSNGVRHVIRDNIVQNNIDNYSITGSPINEVHLLLSQLPETIDFPCAARVVGPYTASTAGTAINITASDVSIDLGGFALDGGGLGSNIRGIDASAGTNNIRIFNGEVRNWSGAGISISTGEVRNITARLNGSAGISVGGNSLIEDCTAISNGGSGIITLAGTTIRRVNVVANSNSGVRLAADCQIEDSTASGNTLGGFILAESSRVQRCTARNHTAGTDNPGFSAAAGSPNAVIQDCYAEGNDIGYFVFGGGCTVVRNIAKSNTAANFSVGGGNHVGDVVATPGTADAYDNIAN
jgi:hypothetical protein